MIRRLDNRRRKCLIGKEGNCFCFQEAEIFSGSLLLFFVAVKFHVLVVDSSFYLVLLGWDLNLMGSVLGPFTY